MSRVQLALNVSDVDAAVAFYSKLFGTEPAKRRPGYANFAVDEPPLKLVLIENALNPGSLNHLGVEVGTADDVVTESRRLAEAGLTSAIEEDVECCYAKQDKFWVEDPDRAPWEIYTVLADSEVLAPQRSAASVATAAPGGAVGCGPGCC
ncbi:MAG TPA: ArsI/CadI family heavy metal resistance metalloenzyme [Candidatus Dormibacteraeota bacterium]|jgi:catechol 2,3-dioxygenase-like lactoylglutathione lyase family enzyme|nr:ArsI/CadI family heavy metal resistance metalloenzyme [Candidatus Dormibacteraeota bacterium]